MPIPTPPGKQNVAEPKFRFTLSGRQKGAPKIVFELSARTQKLAHQSAKAIFANHKLEIVPL